MTASAKNQPFSYPFEQILPKSKVPVDADRIAEAVMRRIEKERKHSKV